MEGCPSPLSVALGNCVDKTGVNSLEIWLGEGEGTGCVVQDQPVGDCRDWGSREMAGRDEIWVGNTGSNRKGGGLL